MSDIEKITDQPEIEPGTFRLLKVFSYNSFPLTSSNPRSLERGIGNNSIIIIQTLTYENS